MSTVTTREPEILTCGHPSDPPPNGTGPAGYATLRGLKICYACADMFAIEELKTEDRAFCYLSSDQRQLMTWTGGKLMTVTSVKVARTGFRDISGRRPERYYFRAVDVHGVQWTGSGAGPNMYARMRKRLS